MLIFRPTAWFYDTIKTEVKILKHILEMSLPIFIVLNKVLNKSSKRLYLVPVFRSLTHSYRQVFIPE